MNIADKPIDEVDNMSATICANIGKSAKLMNVFGEFCKLNYVKDFESRWGKILLQSYLSFRENEGEVSNMFHSNVNFFYSDER